MEAFIRLPEIRIMKRKSDLYHLINAMSKSEKRYFTVDVQKSNKKGSRYLELFHTITAMEPYDEKELKKKFGTKLPHDKRYLYDAILRSMRDYRSTNSYAAQIREMILDARYLFERELYDQCAERLENAKHLALKMDDQTAMLEIIGEERKLILGRRQVNFGLELKNLEKTLNQVLESIQEEMNYQSYYEKLYTQVAENFELKNEREKHELQQFFGDKLLNSSPQKSNKAVYRYFQCLALYHQLLGNDDERLNYYTKVVEWWEENPKNKKEEFFRFIADASNLLYAYITKGKFDELLSLINIMESSEPSNQHDKGVIFQRVSIYKLMYHLNSGKLHNVQELIDKITWGLNAYTINKNSRLSLISNLATLLFIKGDTENCAHWCKRIIKTEKNESRKDVQAAIGLLYLCAIMEKDEIDETEKGIRMINRFLKKLGVREKNSFEVISLGFLQKINNAPLSEIQNGYKNFQAYLMQTIEQKHKIAHGMNELLLLWVRSKLEKKSIINLLGWEND